MTLVLFTSQILRVANCNLLHLQCGQMWKKSIYKLTVSFMAFSGATPNSCGNRPANGNREFKALSNLVLNKQINKCM